jgi:hypothetical protein
MIEHLAACTESRDKDAKAKIATFQDMAEGYELLAIDYRELNLSRLGRRREEDGPSWGRWRPGQGKEEKEEDEADQQRDQQGGCI